MRKNLPEYIVNCFLAAGYDTLPIIDEMDVSDEPGNSLQVIEEFIFKQHPNDPEFYHKNNTAALLFPPGHRRRIERFVRDVTKHLEEEHTQLNHKRRAVNSASTPKRDGQTSSSGNESSSD